MLETTERDKAYDSLKAKQEASGKAKGVLRGAGYARGGGVGRERPKAAGKKPMHSAEPKKAGGKIGGGKPPTRPDKGARGGSKPSGHHTRINVNIGAGQAEKQNALKAGVQIGARLAAAKLAGGAGAMPAPGPRPMAGASMQARGAPPMAAPGPAPEGPPPMANRGGAFKRGGKVGPKKVAGVTNVTEGGAGGAKGRMEKIRKYGGK